MERQERYDYYSKITKRLLDLGYNVDGTTLMMDIESADLHFQLKLKELYEANDENFTHDVVGIMNHIDRTSLPSTNFNFFLPRYAN